MHRGEDKGRRKREEEGRRFENFSVWDAPKCSQVVLREVEWEWERDLPPSPLPKGRGNGDGSVALGL